MYHEKTVQERIAQILFSLLFTAALLSISLLFFLHRDPETTSYYENRSLALYPVAEADTVADGSWFQELEKWFCDYAPGRDTALKLRTWMDLHLLRRPVVNDVVVTDQEFLLSYNGFSIPDPALAAESASLAADQLLQIRQTVDSYGGTFLYTMIPAHYAMLEDRYPWYMDSLHDKTALEKGALRSALDAREVPWLDIGDVWLEEGAPLSWLSRSDHHWSLDGCMSACRAILEKVRLYSSGTPPLPDSSFHIRTVSAPYLGSYNRKLCGLWTGVEQLLYAERKDLVPFHRWNWSSDAESAPTLFSPDPDRMGNIAYTFFMGGDISETVIQTDRPDLPSLLIVGDSFTNLAETILYGEFDEMRSLDFRFYDTMTLPEYIRLHQPDVVLILRDYEQLLQLEGNGKLVW